MTAARKFAITGAILALAFAASTSGAALAGQQRAQTNGATASSNMTTQADDNTSASTGAGIHALNTYLLWKKHCTNNLLPRCQVKPD